MQKSLLAIAILLTSVAFNAEAARVYKWVDDNGHVHFGDKIPAKYTNNPHEELSKSGKTIESVGRAKSRDEMRAERLAKEAEAKRVETERQQKLEQARQDQILLDTFSSERDIIIMRDDRLGAIDANMRLTESYNAQLRSRLEKSQSSVDELVKNNKPIPERLQKELDGLQAQLDKNNVFVERSNKEKAEINEQFSKDLARFKLLRARRYK